MAAAAWSTGHADLDRAIEKAASRYQVPPDLLAGIWRIESGSTYPNPAVNSAGYGGLFGTSDAFGSTQAQANLSASILANGLRQSGGDISQALSYYNSGKLYGGYTSVPGEITFGNVQAPSSVPPTPNPLDGGAYQAPARPGGQDTSFGGDVLGALSFEANPIGALLGALGGAGSTLGAIKSFFSFLMIVFDPRNWLRAFEAFVGVVLILLGLYYFGKSEGGEDVDLRTLLRSPGRLAGGAASGTSRAGQRAVSGSLVGRGARRAARTAR